MLKVLRGRAPPGVGQGEGHPPEYLSPASLPSCAYLHQLLQAGHTQQSLLRSAPRSIFFLFSCFLVYISAKPPQISCGIKQGMAGKCCKISDLAVSPAFSFLCRGAVAAAVFFPPTQQVLDLCRDAAF